MKMLPRTLLFLTTLCLATVSLHAIPGMAGLDYTVKKDPGSSVISQGKTDARGSFSTASLAPGSYVVEFRSAKGASMKGTQLSLTINGGKHRVEADGVPGEKFSAGGVAMKVEVAKAAKLSGQVSAGGAAAVASTDKMENARANVKVMNGKRYVWVPAPIGSNMGGKWVEEGTEGAVVSQSNKKGGDAEALRKVIGLHDGGAVPQSVGGGN